MGDGVGRTVEHHVHGVVYVAARRVPDGEDAFHAEDVLARLLGGGRGGVDPCSGGGVHSCAGGGGGADSCRVRVAVRVGFGVAWTSSSIHSCSS